MLLPVEAWSQTLLAHPALDAVRPYADRLAPLDAWPSVEVLDSLLSDRLAIEPAVSLERQHGKRKRRRAPLDRSAIYAVRIHEHRRVPTRERSLHDLTNALVWAAFPRSKRALTARQHAITIARVPPEATSLPNARTREEDALAMLDEGGIVIAAAPDVEPDVVGSIFGWTPAQFTVRRHVRDASLTATDIRHPVFRPFGALSANLGAVRFREMWDVAPAGWSVPARFDDGTPALLERAVA